MNESFQSALSKIPLALDNMKVENARMVQNYIENLVMTVFKDEKLIGRLKNDELLGVLEEIKKL